LAWLAHSRQAPAISYCATLAVVVALLLAMAWVVLAVLVTTVTVTAAPVVAAEAALLVVVVVAAAVRVATGLGLICCVSIDSWRQSCPFCDPCR